MGMAASIETFLTVAEAVFSTQPEEVTFLYAASCCGRSTVLEQQPIACGKCRREIYKYLRLYRDGTSEEVLR